MIKKYDKLVRDNIPSIIKESNKDCEIRIVIGEEKLQYLFKKLDEEIIEFKENKSLEELADVRQVLSSIATELNIKETELESFRAKKEKENGGFEKGIVLVSVKDFD